MILLSFDIEEFDLPLECGGEISFEEQISISQTGLEHILNLLDRYQAKATFFSTVVFAQNSPNLVARLLESGHELASHTYYHSNFELPDLKKSREILEEIFQTKVIGLRMPRMVQIDQKEVASAGYIYNSSLNPTYLPGRYNHLSQPRRYYETFGIKQIPSSVSPILRIPLFWLAFHNFPVWLYRMIAKKTYKHDGYLNLYFHPWEFADIQHPNFKLTQLLKRNSGNKMVKRFEGFLKWINENQYKTGTFSEFLEKIK